VEARNVKGLFFLAGMLLISGIAFAGPKPATKAFSLSCAQVWQGAKAAVQSNYDVLSLNDQTRSGSFTTGSFWTGVRFLTFALRGSSDGCTVAVTGHFSGFLHNDKADFFRRIQDALTLKPESIKTAFLEK
jgi:hypothetical protein